MKESKRIRRSDRPDRGIVNQLRTVFRFDRSAVTPILGVVGALVLLGLGILRIRFGHEIFVACIAALLALLIVPATKPKSLTRSLTSFLVLGATLTLFGVMAARSTVIALIFVGVVTFVCSLAITSPPTYAAIALFLNVWIVNALKLTPDTSFDSAGRAAVAFAFGGMAALIAADLLKRLHRSPPPDDDVLITPDPLQIPPPDRVRKPVLSYTIVRTSAAVVGGLVGVTLFPDHPWFVLETVLLVISIDPLLSLLAGVQRSVGAVIGISVGTSIVTATETTLYLFLALLMIGSLTVAVRKCGQLWYAAGVFAALILIIGLSGGDVWETGKDRLAATLIGVGISLVAAWLVQPYLQEVEYDLKDQIAEYRSQQGIEPRAI